MESLGYPHLAAAYRSDVLELPSLEAALSRAIAWERLSSQGWLRFLSLLLTVSILGAAIGPALAAERAGETLRSGGGGGGVGDGPAFVNPDRPVTKPLPPITVRPCPTFKTISSYVYRPPYLRNNGGWGAGAGPCYSCVGGRNVNTSRLQQRLKDLGYFRFRVTGYYGPITEAAVRRFQRDSGLVPDGVAGPRTKAALGLLG